MLHLKHLSVTAGSNVVAKRTYEILKTPEQISTLAAKGVSQAFTDGAQDVFIACNTASTQFAPIKEILGKAKSEHVISIIESSVTELKHFQ